MFARLYAMRYLLPSHLHNKWIAFSRHIILALIIHILVHISATNQVFKLAPFLYTPQGGVNGKTAASTKILCWNVWFRYESSSGDLLFYLYLYLGKLSICYARLKVQNNSSLLVIFVVLLQFLWSNIFAAKFLTKRQNWLRKEQLFSFPVFGRESNSTGW